MTVTVFTCVVGDTPDELRVPLVISPDVRYVCLSDRRSSSPPYTHVRVHVPPDLGAPLFARKLKILADHPALGTPDVLLWHDAAFQLQCHPVEVARTHLRDVDLLAFAHPDRTTIEAEGMVIAQLGYAPLATMTAQAATYRAEGFPPQTAITSTGFSLRRRTPEVQTFNACWWEELARWTYRDQMSVDYAIWKTGVRVAYIPGHYRENPFARWYAETPFARRQRALTAQGLARC